METDFDQVTNDLNLVTGGEKFNFLQQTPKGSFRNAL